MGVAVSTLDEKDRKKLDTIVQQMQANNEPDENIRFVVDDFKSKYDIKKKASLGDVSKALSVGGQANIGATPSTVKPIQKIEDYNKSFEQATGHSELSLGSDLPQIKKAREESKYLKNRSIEEYEINPVLNAVKTGTVQPQQLAELYNKPYGKKLVGQIVSENVPHEMQYSALDNESVGADQKWNQIAGAIQEKNRPQALELQNKNETELNNEIANSLKTFTYGEDRVGVRGGGEAFTEQKRNPFGDINTSSAADLQKAADHISNNQGVWDSEGNKVDKKELLKKINSRIFQLKAGEEIHPEIQQESEMIKKVAESMPGEWKRQGGNANMSDIDAEYVMAGLNYIRDTKPGEYKTLMSTMKVTGKMPETEFTKLANLGRDVKQYKYFKSGGYVQNDERSLLTPQLKKAELAGWLSEELARKGFRNRSAYTEREILDVYKNAPEGIKDDELVNQIIKAERAPSFGFIPIAQGEGLVKKGVLNSAMRGIAVPIQDVLNSVDVGFTSTYESPFNAYLKSKELDNGDPTIINKKGDFAKRLDENFWNKGVEGFFNVLTQSYLARGFGNIAKAPINAAIGRTYPMAALSSNKAAITLGTPISTLAQTYGDEYVDFLEKTGSPTKATLGAFASGLVQGEIERFVMPDVKLVENMGLIGAKKNFANELIEAVDKGLGKEGVAEAVKKYVGNVTKIIGKEAWLEEGAQNFTNYVTEKIISPQTAKDRDILKETIDTGLAATPATFLYSLLGAAGETKTQRGLTKSQLNAVAVNPQQFIDALGNQLSSGAISQAEYDLSTQIINKHAENSSNAPKRDANGDLISADRQLEYAYQSTVADYAQQQADKQTDKIQKEPYLKKVEEADKIKRKIFYGEEVAGLPKTEEEVKPDPKVVEETRLDEIASQALNKVAPTIGEGEDAITLSDESALTQAVVTFGQEDVKNAIEQSRQKELAANQEEIDNSATEGDKEYFQEQIAEINQKHDKALSLIPAAVEEKTTVDETNRPKEESVSVPEENNIESFETSQGSVYKIGDDGKTSRFKTKTGEQKEPQDLTVFVKFKDQQNDDYLQALHGQNGQSVHVMGMIDGKVQEIKTNEDAAKADNIKLTIVDKEGKITDKIDAVTNPEIGYSVFDQRNLEGDKYQKHIGNEVVKINPKTESQKTTVDETKPVVEEVTEIVEPKPSKEGEPPTGTVNEDSEGSGKEPPKPPKEEPPVDKEEKGKAKDKGILNHLHKAKNIPEAARKGFEEEGLKYETKNQTEAYEVAKGIIEEVGIDEAVEAAEAMKFDGDVNSLIFAEALNQLKAQEDAATTPEEKLEIAKRFAEIGITYDKMARYGGRFNAAINYFYRKSPLGIVMMENAKRADDFKQWSKPKDKSWKEFWEEMMKEPEFAEEVKVQVQEELKKERAEARKERTKKVDDFIDKAKDSFKGGAAYSTIIPPKVITAALEGIKKAYHAGEAVAKIVQDAIDYISTELGNAPWDKEKFRKEWEEKLREKETKKPLTDEEVKKRLLDKFRNKLKGLTDSQKDELVSKAYKQIIENGGLDYEDFRKLIAQVTGRADLTDAEAAQMKDLVAKTNAVEDAAENARKERTEESLVKLRTAEIVAGRASKELSELFHNKPDIVKRLTSIMQLSTLGIPALVNNPIYNLWNQATLRLPIGVVNSLIDWGVSKWSKMFGKEFDREYNIIAGQAEFWNKLGLGTKESFQQLATGLSRMDYTAKEVAGQQIRPVRSWKDLIAYAQKRKPLTRAQFWDKAIQGTVGVPAEIVARVLNLGDKPQRFAAEGAQAATFAKNLGLKGMDYKLFVEFPREEAYRAYKAQGLTDEVAGQKADAVAESIIKEGQRSTFQQDNLLNDAITRAAGVLGGKDSGTSQLAKTLVISPYIKIPSNAFWSYYNLINPEVAILQAITHAGIARNFNKKGELTKAKLQNREARYWFAHAIVGMASRAVVIALVKSGTFIPSWDEDDSKKASDANSLFDKPGSVNLWGLKISNRWFGQWGMMGNAIAKKYKDATPEQREAQADFWDIALGGMELSALEEMETGIFANSSSFLQSIGTGDFSRYGINTLNMMANILQPASAAQVERGLLDKVPSSKGDTFLEKLNNNFAQRSILYRKIFDVQLSYKKDIWGQHIPKGGNILTRLFGISQGDPQLFGRPIYNDYLRTTDSGFLPPTVQPMLNGQKITNKQHERLQEYIGSERKKIAEPYVNDMAEIVGFNQKYSQLKTDDQKKFVLQYLYEKGRANGLEKFYTDYPELRPKDQPIDYNEEVQKDIFKALLPYQKN